jgi:hypothetical protein
MRTVNKTIIKNLRLDQKVSKLTWRSLRNMWMKYGDELALMTRPSCRVSQLLFLETH